MHKTSSAKSSRSQGSSTPAPIAQTQPVQITVGTEFYVNIGIGGGTQTVTVYSPAPSSVAIEFIPDTVRVYAKLISPPAGAYVKIVRVESNTIPLPSVPLNTFSPVLTANNPLYSRTQILVSLDLTYYTGDIIVEYVPYVSGIVPAKGSNIGYPAA